MKRLISDHAVSIRLLTQAIHLPAMFNSEIEKAGREAANGYQDHQLAELVRSAEGAECVRIRVIIEPMSLTEYNAHLHRD